MIDASQWSYTMMQEWRSIWIKKKTVADFFVKYPLYITKEDTLIEPIEPNERTIVCAVNQRFNGRILEGKNLFSNDSVCLIGLKSNDEVVGEEYVE